MQFVDFERFTSSYHTKLHEKSCYYLNNVHEKPSQEVKINEILKACARYL